MILNDKVALIVGGARMGTIVARELAKKGCHTAMNYRTSKDAAEEAAAEVRRQGCRAFIVKGNMTQEKDVRHVVAQVSRFFGRLDILINMASIYERSPLKRLDSRDFDRNVEANLKSAYLTSLNVLSFMKKDGGRIINFSDWICASGRPRYSEYIPYYTSKMGVIGLTQALALEFAPEILVNAIAPGPIIPPPRLSHKEKEEVKKMTPLQRWGGVEEIAKTVVFLSETDFVTGECIRVDGGRHLH